MKNIVLISIDSLRADALGCYGNSVNDTRTLDLCAAQGLLFKNVICQAPYTVSSHASLLTGLYPFNHGLRKQFTRRRLRKEHLQILYGLKARGFGLRSFVGVRLFGPEFGYDLWDYQGWSKILTLQRRLPDRSAAPFFAFIHYWGVHTPYSLTRISSAWRDVLGLRFEKVVKNDRLHIPKLDQTYTLLFGGNRNKVRKIRDAFRRDDECLIREIKSGYRRAVEKADAFVREVMEIFRRKKLLDQTLFIITSDHGESWNEHGEIRECPNDYEHGPFLYDTLLKVPLIIWGKDLPSAKVVEQQVQSIDILPTALDLLGIPGEAHARPINGRSLLRYLDAQDRDYRNAYSETKKDSPTERESETDKVSLRSQEGFKLIVDHVKKATAIYDCRQGETEDIQGQHPALAAQMRNDLETLIRSSRIEYPDEDAAMDEKNHQKISEKLESLGYMH